jgi:hypothetical protein
MHSRPGYAYPNVCACSLWVLVASVRIARSSARPASALLSLGICAHMYTRILAIVLLSHHMCDQNARYPHSFPSGCRIVLSDCVLEHVSTRTYRLHSVPVGASVSTDGVLSSFGYAYPKDLVLCGQSQPPCRAFSCMHALVWHQAMFGYAYPTIVPSFSAGNADRLYMVFSRQRQLVAPRGQSQSLHVSVQLSASADHACRSALGTRTQTIDQHPRQDVALLTIPTLFVSIRSLYKVLKKMSFLTVPKRKCPCEAA